MKRAALNCGNAFGNQLLTAVDQAGILRAIFLARRGIAS
jgi:hypothetical protein